MVDVFTEQQRREIMSRVRSRDTKPELVVRRMLHAMGFRFRLHRKDLPGCPDIVLPRYRTVIFVHGCFWHGHSCAKGRRPTSNEKFWNDKIEKNMIRDSRSLRRLRRTGWKTVVIWECQTRNVKYLERRLCRIREYEKRSTVESD